MSNTTAYMLTDLDRSVISANTQMHRDDAIFHAASHYQLAMFARESYGRFGDDAAHDKDYSQQVANELITCLRFLLIAGSDHLIKKYDLYNAAGKWSKIAQEEHQKFYKNPPEYNI